MWSWAQHRQKCVIMGLKIEMCDQGPKNKLGCVITSPAQVRVVEEDVSSASSLRFSNRSSNWVHPAKLKPGLLGFFAAALSKQCPRCSG